MTSIANIQAQVDAIAAPAEVQALDVSQHDAALFQHALVNQVQYAASPTELIQNGIAALENQDQQFRTVLFRLADDGSSSLTTAAAQTLLLQQQKLRVAYEAEARVINLVTQGTNELTHMQ
jgi:hypothetical protein